jgi:hypothetical protein
MLREHRMTHVAWTNAVISVYQQLRETPKEGPGGQGVPVPPYSGAFLVGYRAAAQHHVHLRSPGRPATNLTSQAV